MVPLKLLLAIGLAMALQLVHGAQPPLYNKAICAAPQCILTAASILQDMDPNVDPCEDFSAYTCGGFANREEIPADQESTSYFRILSDENNQIIRSIVDAESVKAPQVSSDDEASQRNIQKLRNLYTSCMDEAQSAEAGRQPLMDEVQKLLEVFPVTGSILTPSPDAESMLSSPVGAVNRNALSLALSYFNKIGLDLFSSFGVTTDLKDPNRHVLRLTEGGLGLPSKEYYLDDRIISIYEATASKMFNLILGEDTNVSSSSTGKTTELPIKWTGIGNDVMNFEKQLAAISTPKKDLRNSEKTYNPFSIDQISSMTPSVDWSFVLKNLLPTDVDTPNIIVVTSPIFQTKLESLLQKTSPQTLQNYMIWSVIRQMAGYLAERYKRPMRELNAALAGISPDVIPERWKYCVSIVNDRLGQMAGHYFVKESFKGSSRTQVYDMVETIRSTYLKNLPELDWLDEPTVAGAVKKMKAIAQLIGFSTDAPNVASSESLEEYFKGYSVDPMDYFGNMMRGGLWETESSFKELSERVNKLQMHMSSQTVNAYYSPTQNQIVFPAGILQPPFFHADNPEYVNYGSIGVVAGHEITHGFDNMGHLFDSEGRLINWWTKATTDAFDSKAQCFVEQYGNFTILGPDGKNYHVDGQLTLGENIADNGGLKNSHEAWQARFNSDPAGWRYKNFRLPGLDRYTPEQLFFISYARLWCSKQRPEALVRQLRTDPHGPAKWRINGAVQNSVAFARAFSCPTGAPMNPERKCGLW
ncbi:hypothetical protein BC939DRAFT_406393 [Gamsiella multidivaricata]|uniref:uncharacterized protein n=1 Tax=Gamsiella multidivaricata TaxID=101098 RepID=UPI002220CE50|nr:uncharacterized protein BC939DRAFT_406393 [Gamsiella multidivaricata]KAI7831240.1 hypothetical protein BC939DRAFT_406393 [Gamsiella multidivaricata]